MRLHRIPLFPPFVTFYAMKSEVRGNFCTVSFVFRNNLKKEDLRRVNSHLREIDIRDHASLKVYSAENQCAVDILCAPRDIYLYCVIRGNVTLSANFIPHVLDLGTAEAIFLAYPKEAWNVRVMASKDTEFYTIRMDVSTLHKLINPAFNDHQLEGSSRLNMRDLMKMIPVSPALMICFDQLLHHKIKAPFNEIFERAKFLEIFSLLMESAFGQPMEACPVALSHAIESKLQQVRRHIIDHLDASPDPDKLAVLYDLQRQTLREGFKYIFGKTIHQYHTDHKLEHAMRKLNEGEMLVKEVAFSIGYQNPSHFISAFKKKFGFTPKQYLKRETLQV